MRSNVKALVRKPLWRQRKRVRKERGFALCQGIVGYLSCIILFSKEKSPSFLWRENHLSTVKGDSFCIDKAPARRGRKYLSIVIAVLWKANAVRYHAARFNEACSSWVGILSRKLTIPRAFSWTFKLDSINRNISWQDGMTQALAIGEGSSMSHKGHSYRKFNKAVTYNSSC